MTSGEYKASVLPTWTSGWLSSAAARETQTSFVADGSSEEHVQHFGKKKKKKSKTQLKLHTLVCGTVAISISVYLMS